MKKRIFLYLTCLYLFIGLMVSMYSMGYMACRCKQILELHGVVIIGCDELYLAYFNIFLWPLYIIS